MSSLPVVAQRPDPWSDPRLRAPSAEEWAGMSEAERTGAEQRILDALAEHRQDQFEDVEEQRKEAEQHRAEAVERLESARTGMIDLLLRWLAQRGLALTEQQRAQVLECADLGRLLRWLDLASSAPTIEDVLSA